MCSLATIAVADPKRSLPDALRILVTWFILLGAINLRLAFGIGSLIWVAAFAGIANAQTTVTLDQPTIITNGLKMCDTSDTYCLDITLDGSNAGAETAVFSDTGLGRISQGGVVSGTEHVKLDYNVATLNSVGGAAAAFTFDALTMIGIDSLTDGATATDIRDSYTFLEPGFWTALAGSGPDANPAIVSIDTSAADDVGVFIVLDPDLPLDNNLSEIGQFTVPTALGATNNSEVLLNMSGNLNFHNASYTFDTTAQNSVSLIVFNSGDGTMQWSFTPTITIDIPVPELTTVKTFGSATVNADGTFEVPVTIDVTNSGFVTITNLQLTDDLADPSNLGTAFQAITAGPTISVTDDGSSPAAVAPSAAGVAYNGDGQPNFLAGTDGTLGSSDVLTVQMTILVDPNAVGAPASLENTATASGEDPSGNPTSDDSGGASGGAGLPTGLSNPQSATVEVVKSVSIGAVQGDGSVDAAFTITMENTGNVDLANPSLIDNLEAQIPTVFTPSTSATATGGIIAGPIVSSDNGLSTVVANASYNGDGSTANSGGDLIDGSALLVGETITVTFTAKIEAINAASQPFSATNFATGLGTAPDSSTASDLSGSNGANDTPTPLVAAAVVEELTARKVLTATSANLDGTINLTFEISVENTGNVDFSGVTLADDMNLQFGSAYAPSTAANTAGGVIVAPSVTSGAATANANFDGDGGSNVSVINSIANFAPGDFVSATFTAQINPNAVGAPSSFTNQANGVGTGPSGLFSDPSDSSNPDWSEKTSDGVGPDDPTPVPIPSTNAELTVLKTGDYAGLSSPPMAGDIVSYTISVQNTGALTVNGITVTDTLTDGSGNPLPIAAPIWIGNSGVSPQGTLAPGETGIYAAAYPLSQSDIDSGGLSNTATADGTDTLANPVNDVSDDPTSTAGPVGAAPTVLAISLVPSVEVTKTASLADGGDGTADPGDVVNYTYTIQNTGNVVVLDASVTEATADFNGNGPLPVPVYVSGGSDQDADLATDDLLPGEVATYTASYTLVAADIAQGGLSNQATGVGSTATLGLVSDASDNGDDSDGNSSGDPTVLAFVAPELRASKLANVTTIENGGVITFTIEIEHVSGGSISGVEVVDELPPGLLYVANSGRVNGSPANPTITGQTLVWPGVSVPTGGRATVTLDTAVSHDAPDGDISNIAYAQTAGGDKLTNIARIIIEKDPIYIFKCADIIGRVFEDRNMDGYFSEGEGGVPEMHVFTANGDRITTDEYGRFHVPCAEIPHKNGSNYILKLDERSLPPGYFVTTDNPRVQRITQGKMVQFNFGIANAVSIDIELSASAFVSDKAEATDALTEGINVLVDSVFSDTATLNFKYQLTGENPELAKARLDELEILLHSKWTAAGKHQLFIQTEIVDVE